MFTSVALGMAVNRLRPFIPMAGALVAVLKAPLFAALFTMVLVQKETAPVIAVAVVISALLTVLQAPRRSRRLAGQTGSFQQTESNV